MRRQGAGNHSGGDYPWRNLAAGACRRGRHRGQSLIIFVLSLTVLLGLAGLAVDATRAYDLYARMQRAAEAGALAGVMYMPNSYSTPRSAADPNSAISRASQEVVKNGFGTVLPNSLPATYFGCPNSPPSFEVAVCPITTQQSDLRVTITEQLSVVVLGALGVQPITLQASGQAEFLPPVQIGARANYFGDQTECSSGSSTSYCDPSASGTHLNDFFATFDGPAALKESGDPMVYCEEGPSGVASASDLDGSTTFPAYNGDPTNHAQWLASGPITARCGNPVAGGNPGNPDNQPPGYDGPATRGTAHPGGYNYEISVAPGLHASLWIYNPNYVPVDGGGSYLTLDHFIDSGAACHYQGPRGEGIGCRWDGSRHDAPLFFFTTTVTLYSVVSQYDRSGDTLVPGYSGGITNPMAFKPYDATSADLSAHGCSNITSLGNGTAANLPIEVYDPFWNGANTANTYHNPGSVSARQGCVSTTTTVPCMLRWCKISPPAGLDASNGGLYRLVIEATGLNANTSDYNSSSLDGYGQHSYSLKICDDPAATTPINCGDGSGATGSGQFNTAPLAIFGWNNMDVTFQNQLSLQTPNPSDPKTSCVTGTPNTAYTCMDIGCIPSEYAGRDVTARIFDVGDGGGTGQLYVAVVPPPGSTASVAAMPSYIPTANVDGNAVSVLTRGASGTYTVFNGRWLSFQLHMPANYRVDCTISGTGGGWWQIMYASASGFHPDDKVGVQFNLVGSPIHLLPPIFL